MGPESYKEININREELREQYMREAGRELTNTKTNVAVEKDRRRDHYKKSIPGRYPMHSLL